VVVSHPIHELHTRVGEIQQRRNEEGLLASDASEAQPRRNDGVD